MKMLRGVTFGIALTLAAVSASAQPAPLTEDPEFLRMGSGDLKFRAGFTLSKVSNFAEAVTFIPDFGWTGDLFMAKHDFSPGWNRRANEWGFNSFCYSATGTGHADEPPSRDLPTLSEWNVYNTYQMGMASNPAVLVAHGVGAAYAVKARTYDVKVADVLVLIDPLPPQGIGPRPELSIRQLREERLNLRDRLWVKWGIGDRPGRVDEKSDIGPEGFERLMERYEPDHPAYWAAALTGMDGNLELTLGSADLLDGVPVLMVGTPDRDREQRKREKALIEFLKEAGCTIDRFEIEELGLEGIGGLPMAGDHSTAVLDHILTWAQSKLALREES